MTSKHGANSWEHYQNIHARRIVDFRDHFLRDDGLSWTFTEEAVYWEGTLYCRGGIEIQVEKHQSVEWRNGRPYVQTIEYKY